MPAAEAASFGDRYPPRHESIGLTDRIGHMRLHVRSAVIVVALALALVGCAPAAPAPRPTAIADATHSATSSPSATATPTSTPEVAAAVVLRPEGFQILGDSYQLLHEQDWAEGIDQAVVALDKAFGMSAAIMDAPGDGMHFGPGIRYQWDDFTVLDSSASESDPTLRRYVAYVTSPDVHGVEMRTVEGITVGMSLATASQLGLIRTDEGYVADPTDPESLPTSEFVRASLLDGGEEISRLYAPVVYSGNL